MLKRYIVIYTYRVEERYKTFPQIDLTEWCFYLELPWLQTTWVSMTMKIRVVTTTNKYRYILRPAQYAHRTGVVMIHDSLYVHEKLIWSKMFQTEQSVMSAAIFRCWEYQFEGSVEIERSTSHDIVSLPRPPATKRGTDRVQRCLVKWQAVG